MDKYGNHFQYCVCVCVSGVHTIARARLYRHFNQEYYCWVCSVPNVVDSARVVYDFWKPRIIQSRNQRRRQQQHQQKKNNNENKQYYAKCNNFKNIGIKSLTGCSRFEMTFDALMFSSFFLGCVFWWASFLLRCNRHALLPLCRNVYIIFEYICMCTIFSFFFCSLSFSLSFSLTHTLILFYCFWFSLRALTKCTNWVCRFTSNVTFSIDVF